MPPPAPPGANYRTLVRVTFLAAGDLASFDAIAFRDNLLNLFTAAIGVIVKVAGGSVAVDASIILPSGESGLQSEAARNVQQVLTNSSLANLSAALGVTLEAVGKPTITTELVLSLPPAPAPPTTPGDHFADGGTFQRLIDLVGGYGVIMICVGLVVCVFLPCLCGFLCCYRSRVRQRLEGRKLRLAWRREAGHAYRSAVPGSDTTRARQMTRARARDAADDEPSAGTRRRAEARPPRSSEVTFDVTPASRPPLPQDAPPPLSLARTGGAKRPPQAARPEHGLPQSWEALRDEDGMVYYHNTQTGATSWEPPQPDAAAAPERPAAAFV